MMLRMAAVSYRFLLELLSAFLILFFYYITNDEVPPLLLLSSVGLGTIIFLTALLSKFKQKGIWLFFAAVVPILLVICAQTSLSLIAGAVFIVLIFWRGLVLFEDPVRHSDTWLLLLSFLIGMGDIVYSAMIRYPFQNMLIYLLLTQVLLTLLGSFFRKWYRVQADRPKFIWHYIKILAGFLAISGVAAFLVNDLQTILFAILQAAAWAFTTIAQPIFFILQFLLRSYSGGEVDVNFGENNPPADEWGLRQDQPYGSTENFFYVLLILAAAALIIYLIKRKLKIPAGSAHSVSYVIETAGGMTQQRLAKSRTAFKPPEDRIRREIYFLEMYASKRDLGRHLNETLEEWWQRVGITSTAQSIEIYNRVRYKETKPTAEELKYVKTQVQNIKQQLKEIHKAARKRK